MGEALHAALDVAIVYPQGRPTIADLFADRVPAVWIRIVERPIPRELIGGDYENDPQARSRVQAWINELWREKDATIAAMLQRAQASAACEGRSAA